MDTVSSNLRAVGLGLVVCATLGFAGCTVIAPAPVWPQSPSTADLTFDGIGKRYLEELLPLTPLTATALGDHRYDALLDDVSAQGRQHRVELARRLLSQLQQLDPLQMT